MTRTHSLKFAIVSTFHGAMGCCLSICDTLFLALLPSLSIYTVSLPLILKRKHHCVVVIQNRYKMKLHST